MDGAAHQIHAVKKQVKRALKYRRVLILFMLIHGADPANNIAKHALKTGSTKRGIRRRFLTTRGAENQNIRMSAMKTIINLKRFLHPQKNLKFQGDKIPERE